MRIFGIIGRPLGHSFSAGYFTRKFEELGLADECRYYNFELSSLTELADLRARYPDLEGFNVTIPYKREIVPWLNELAPEAEEIGAVNCVKVVRDGGASDGRLVGYNTDAHGFEVGLEKLLGGAPEAGLKALVLGTGGASCAVRWVLKHKGIDYQMVSRVSGEGFGGEQRLSYDELTPKIIEHNKLIINTTPLGTFPEVEGKPALPYDAVGKEHFLYDLVYNPTVTAFLTEGVKRGAAILNGETMLHAQAEKNWEIWSRNIGNDLDCTNLK